MTIDFDGKWSYIPQPVVSLRFRGGMLEALVWSYQDSGQVWVRVPDENAPGPDITEVVKTPLPPD